MPLPKLFGGHKSKGNGGTPQSVEKSKEKDGREMRGHHLKVDGVSVTIDSKLAEGGFAIVYKVQTEERRPRTLALKRQFVSEDDPRQIAACRREYEIVRMFGAHKNIITFYAASIKAHSSGVMDYLLLTEYYNSSVLALMNSRLAVNRWLSIPEVIAIICDMCEAVACLHHSHTPIWHGDLKVENILIDRQTPPNYVLCDFGSASTRTLSTREQSHAVVEEEVLKYTTLSYRAPEMIDLFAGHCIGIKTDIWALGVMLYKLCYFTLPFGESTLAIQNGSYSYPDAPEYPREIKALIRYMLEPDVDFRPDIAQLAHIAFKLGGRPNPVKNICRSPMHDVDEVLSLLVHHERGGTSETHPLKHRVARHSDQSANAALASDVGTLIDPDAKEAKPRSGEPVATSIAPRIRPKASGAMASPRITRAAVDNVSISSSNSANRATAVIASQSVDRFNPSPSVSAGVAHSSSFTKPTDLGFTDLPDSHIVASAAAQSRGMPPPQLPERYGSLQRPTHANLPSSVNGQFERTASSGSSASQHRRNYSDTTAIRLPPSNYADAGTSLTTPHNSDGQLQQHPTTAFKPYASPTKTSNPSASSSSRSSGIEAAGKPVQQLKYFPPTDEFDLRARSAVDLTHSRPPPVAVLPVAPTKVVLPAQTTPHAKPPQPQPRKQPAAQRPMHDWNPFTDAPFSSSASTPPSAGNDTNARRIFNPEAGNARRSDRLPHSHHHRSSLIGATIMETDPFGAAPFRQLAVSTANRAQQSQPCQSSSSSQMTLRDGSSNGSLTDTGAPPQAVEHRTVVEVAGHDSDEDAVRELQPMRSRYRQLHDAEITPTTTGNGTLAAKLQLPDARPSAGDNDSVGSATDLSQRMHVDQSSDSSTSSEEAVTANNQHVLQRYVPAVGMPNSSGDDGPRRPRGNSKAEPADQDVEHDIDEANLLDEDELHDEHVMLHGYQGEPPPRVPVHQGEQSAAPTVASFPAHVDVQKRPTPMNRDTVSMHSTPHDDNQSQLSEVFDRHGVPVRANRRFKGTVEKNDQEDDTLVLSERVKTKPPKLPTHGSGSVREKGGMGRRTSKQSASKSSFDNTSFQAELEENLIRSQLSKPILVTLHLIISNLSPFARSSICQ